LNSNEVRRAKVVEAKRLAAKKIEDERLAKQLFDDVSAICNSKLIDVFRPPLLNKF
jgi:hypothetical protein